MGDAVAGLSVALVLIPQSIAYASIAGLPPQVGLFAATLPLIVAAPFVCCPWLQTGPTAMTSLLTYGALATLTLNTVEDKVAAAAMLALIIGCTRFLLGFAGLGSFTKLLSRQVILGFTTGAAILIIASQLPKVLGVNQAGDQNHGGVSVADTNADAFADAFADTELSADNGHVIIEAFQSFIGLDWFYEAILIAVATAAFIYLSRRIHRLFPGIFLAMIVAIIYSAWRQYEGDVVGDLPGGFISLNLDFPWSEIGSLIFPGIMLAFVGFAEPASISMTLMEEEKREWNPNQELCGGGCANLVSGLIGGYPVGGSFSRTSVNHFAGADTSWSGFLTGAAILSLLWLTPYLKDLPNAAIGAVVIVAVFRLIKFKEIWQEFRLDKIQGTVAIVALFATIISAPRVDIGIAIGATFGIAAGYWGKRTPQSRQSGDDQHSGGE